VEPRPNIEKSKRQQKWNFVMSLLPGLFGALIAPHFDSTPNLATGALLFGCVALLVGGALWARSPALDVQAVVTRRKRLDQGIVLVSIMMAPLFWLSSDGDWAGRAWSGFLGYAALVLIRRNRLWQIGERQARELESVARQAGLTANNRAPGVYEGMRGNGCIRIRIDEPMILHSLGPAAWLEYVLFAMIFVAGAWLGWPWAVLAALATLLWGWHASRFRVRFMTLHDDGTDERQTLRRLSDVSGVIGPDTLLPVDAARFPIESEVDLPDLLAQVEIATDGDDLFAALRMIGEAGYPETIKLLLSRLRQRKEAMSPRSIAAAEAAVGRIRERHHVPEPGTLAISEPEEAGRLAVARDAGTLTLPPRDGSR
jgi:hypothetical protein